MAEPRFCQLRTSVLYLSSSKERQQAFCGSVCWQVQAELTPPSGLRVSVSQHNHCGNCGWHSITVSSLLRIKRASSFLTVILFDLSDIAHLRPVSLFRGVSPLTPGVWGPASLRSRSFSRTGTGMKCHVNTELVSRHSLRSFRC